MIKLKIINPDLSDLQKTLLATTVGTGKSINVESVAFFYVNDFIVIGDLKTDSAELHQINSITDPIITIKSDLLNTHLQAEQVSKALYDKINIYASNEEFGIYDLVRTIDITYENNNGETIFVDEDDNNNFYKTSYFNSFTDAESKLSQPIKSTGLFSYMTIEEFRVRTGIKHGEVNNTVLSDLLYEGSREVKKKCYAQIETESPVKKIVNGETRYFFKNRYLADNNLDGRISTADIIVEEYSSNGAIVNDITDKVIVLNDLLGYFVLDAGYPSQGLKIRVSYAYCNYRFNDIVEDLKNLAMYYSLVRVVNRNMTDSFKRGISGQSLGGLSVDRNVGTFEGLLNRYYIEINFLLEKIKPLVCYDNGFGDDIVQRRSGYTRGRYGR